MLNFLKKLFMRNPKHYIVSGPSVPEKDFTNKRNARKFLFQNSENGYDAMIDCLDTDPCCKYSKIPIATKVLTSF